MSKNETGMKHRLSFLIPLFVFLFLLLSTALANPKTAYAAAPLGAVGAAPQLKCEITVLSWAICPVIDAMAGAVGALDDFINKQMSIGTPGTSNDPNQIFCDRGSTGNARTSCDAYHKAWTSIRNIALGLMVVASIIVLTAQALGFELLDAYTIRKVLPRLLISALAITLSWQLMQFAITLSNDLAFGVRVLIYQPFTGVNAAALTGGNQFIGSLFSFGALTALGWIGLLSFVVSALIAVFLGVLVLVLRQLLIIVLVIFSPVAIVAYILPNTQRFYKLWWESFSKALLMFALISAMIATGRVFSAVSSLNSTSPIDELAGFAAYFLPYFLIPSSFRLAGGALSQISGFVNARGQGALGALSKYRGNVARKNWQDLKEGNRLKGEDIPGYGRFARGFNTATRNTANFKNAGYTPWRFRERMRAASSSNTLTAAGEAAEKIPEFRTLLGNDDVMEAALYESVHGGGEGTVRSILEERGFAPDMVMGGVAAYRQSKRAMGTEVFKTALAVNSFGTSSGWTPRYKKNAVTGAWIDSEGNDTYDESERVLLRGSGGAGEARGYLDSVAGNDRLRMIGMLGQARQQAESKGRFDLVGGSFTQDVLNMEKFHKGDLGGSVRGPDGAPSGVDKLTQLTHEGVLDGQSRYRIATGHRRSADALFPEMASKLQDTLYRTRGEPGWSPDEGIAQLAFLADSLDAASNGAPENARVLKREVLDKKIDVKKMDVRMIDRLGDLMYEKVPRKNPDGTPMTEVRLNAIGERVTVPVTETVLKDTLTTGDLVERLRSDPEFSRYRREYNRGYDAEAAGRAGEAARPPAGPGP